VGGWVGGGALVWPIEEEEACWEDEDLTWGVQGHFATPHPRLCSYNLRPLALQQLSPMSIRAGCCPLAPRPQASQM
jgi:hypothetical protein